MAAHAHVAVAGLSPFAISTMPERAKHYCQKCGLLATRGNYCDKHAPKRDYSKEAKGYQKPWYSKWYHMDIWERLRAEHLRIEPLCRECLIHDQYVQGIEVDHVEPHRGDWDKFVDQKNLQTLCSACHSRKTRAENRKGQEG